jgi:transcriptional regulator GlxA family with amidase domain
MSPHRVSFLIYPGVASYDVAGPAQALASAGERRYDVTLLSVRGGLVESDCPGLSFGSVPAASVSGPIDTLVIPGGRDAPTTARDPDLIAEVKRLAARAKRVACVCTGAFLAAEAGLLAGRRAATHWRYCDQFADRFHDVQLERDRIWLQDGPVWSSAGISAGVDLTLALIEKDQGVSVALQVARELVVFLKRPGGQSQFSTVLSGQISDADGPLGPLFAWIADHLDADLRAEVLADRAGMSLRTFARTFVARTGLTPAKAVEMIRLEAARDAIEQSDTPLGVIAARCGFGDEQRMRRAFMRQFNATPAGIRARFSL